MTSNVEECPSTIDLESYLDDPSSRVEVEQHLSSCMFCRAAVDEMRANNLLMDRLAQSGLSADDLSASTSSGRGAAALPEIDGYEVQGEIHRGGQGVVYRAVQLATNRTVALKVLLAGAFATSAQRRRFEREIELVAGLNHPHIVTLFESGITRDGLHYCAMHYVQGQTLDMWLHAQRNDQLRNKPFAVRDLLSVYLKICDAVSYAHQRGVIHRDLKPANILVDEHDEPIVLDFGLARPVDAALRPSGRTVTVEGAFVGTLAYASPEQTRGDPALVDVRSDVYSLGVILYELLTGVYPYPVDGELIEVLHAIRETRPKSPRAVVRSAAPESGMTPAFKIGDELDAIVLFALAKEPERRYQSAIALRDDIARHLDARPIHAKHDSGWYLLRKTVQQHRVPVAIAAAIVMLLVVFSVALSFQNVRIRTEVSKLKHTLIFFEDTLGSVQPGSDGGEVTLRELLDEAVEWIGLALSDQPEVAASIRMTVGNSYRSLGLFDKAEEQLSLAMNTRRELFGEKHEQVAHSLNAMGLLRREQGQLEEAEQFLRDGLAMRKRLLGDDHYDVTLSLGNLALLLRDQGELDEAERLFTESLRIRRDLFSELHSDVAMCYYNLADIAFRRGKIEQAIRVHRQSLNIRRQVLSDQHPDLHRSLYTLGSLLLTSDNANAAEPILEECVTLRTATIGDQHWLTAQANSARGAALARLGQFDEAESILLKSQRILLDTFGQDDSHFDWVETGFEILAERPEQAP